jgi:hypothetical protein
VIAQPNQSDWARLFRIARNLIRQVNSEQSIIDRWTFGGATALMLQIGHRESHDVDIFLGDPQLLPYLDPQTRDFKFEIRPSDYRGDGSRFLKLAFDGIGEIDFIVDLPKTAEPTIDRVIDGEKILLETVPEIISKKIVHRASRLQPRDIFDIAAAGEQFSASVITALRSYKTEVATAIKTLAAQNPVVLNEVISCLQIREKFRPLAATAIERASKILQAASAGPLAAA